MVNSENILLSIITVCLNAEKTIEHSIKSVISQKSSEVQYIVIDGDSSDGTKAILNDYKDNIDILISEKDNGIYDAMNKGVQYAIGNFIYFLGSDDVLTPNILHKLLPILASDINAIHYGQVRLQPEKKLYGGKFNKWKIIYKNISHQSIFYPVEILRNKNFNSNYPIAADWDLNLYLMSRHYKFQYNGLTIANFNTHGISFGGDNIFQKNRRKVVKDYFGIIEMIYLVIGIQTPILILNFIITKYLKFKALLRVNSIYI